MGETCKLICVDLKATDELGRIFVIEVQIVFESSFAKSAVFYACQANTDQLRPSQGYSDLKAKYSLCLMIRNLWDDEQLHTRSNWSNGKVDEFWRIRSRFTPLS